jgi:hypothetical protein
MGFTASPVIWPFSYTIISQIIFVYYIVKPVQVWGAPFFLTRSAKTLLRSLFSFTLGIKPKKLAQRSYVAMNNSKCGVLMPNELHLTEVCCSGCFEVGSTTLQLLYSLCLVLS